jgi:hypothetical protein
MRKSKVKLYKARSEQERKERLRKRRQDEYHAKATLVPVLETELDRNLRDQLLREKRKMFGLQA